MDVGIIRCSSDRPQPNRAWRQDPARLAPSDRG
jgi:hypothetical protein